MSERYRLLLVLINTLKRMTIKYHLVNCMHPSDAENYKVEVLASAVMAVANVQITQ